MSKEICITLPTKLDSLRKIEEVVETLSESEEWDTKFQFNIQLVLDELATNIINYGHVDEVEHEFNIKINASEDHVAIDLIDDGQPFDLTQDAPEPDLDADLPERLIGGLGIHLVKQLMDKVEYTREDDKNHLHLVKYKNS